MHANGSSRLIDAIDGEIRVTAHPRTESYLNPDQGTWIVLMRNFRPPAEGRADEIDGSQTTLQRLWRKARGALNYVRRGDLSGLYRRITSQQDKAPPVAMPAPHRYQSFPGATSSSDSFGKLKALRLPPLAGKSFLDVGCNEGFFCGFALFQGAVKSVGLDRNGGAIASARTRFPQCEFLKRSWDELPDERFDIILLASALHYAEDQPDLIRRLVERLNPGGTLVLELGIARGDKEEWVTVRRSIDERIFPTQPKMASVLKDYAWKMMGPSVRQDGDPIPRMVVHVSARVPIAYLLMQPPAYGKTTIAASLFKDSQFPVISGDQFLTRLAYGKAEASEELRELIAKDFSTLRLDRCIEALFDAGLASDYVDGWLNLTGDSDFAFEGFIPRKHQRWVVTLLNNRGYFPVRLEWERLGDGPSGAARVDEAAERYKMFLTCRVG